MRKDTEPKQSWKLSKETLAVAMGIMAGLTLLSPFLTHLDTSWRIFQALTHQDITCPNLHEDENIIDIETGSIAVLSAGYDEKSGLPNIESVRRMKGGAYLYIQQVQGGDDPQVYLLNDAAGEGVKDLYLRNQFQLSVASISNSTISVPNDKITTIPDGDSTISQIDALEATLSNQPEHPAVTIITSSGHTSRTSVIACAGLGQDFQVIAMQDVFDRYDSDLYKSTTRRKPGLNEIKHDVLELVKMLSIPYRVAVK